MILAMFYLSPFQPELPPLKPERKRKEKTGEQEMLKYIDNQISENAKISLDQEISSENDNHLPNDITPRSQKLKVTAARREEEKGHNRDSLSENGTECEFIEKDLSSQHEVFIHNRGKSYVT